MTDILIIWTVLDKVNCNRENIHSKSTTKYAHDDIARPTCWVKKGGLIYAIHLYVEVNFRVHVYLIIYNDHDIILQI